MEVVGNADVKWWIRPLQVTNHNSLLHISRLTEKNFLNTDLTGGLIIPLATSSALLTCEL